MVVERCSTQRKYLAAGQQSDATEGGIAWQYGSRAMQQTVEREGAAGNA